MPFDDPRQRDTALAALRWSEQAVILATLAQSSAAIALGMAHRAGDEASQRQAVACLLSAVSTYEVVWGRHAAITREYAFEQPQP